MNSCSKCHLLLHSGNSVGPRTGKNEGSTMRESVAGILAVSVSKPGATLALGELIPNQKSGTVFKICGRFRCCLSHSSQSAFTHLLVHIVTKTKDLDHSPNSPGDQTKPQVSSWSPSYCQLHCWSFALAPATIKLAGCGGVPVVGIFAQACLLPANSTPLDSASVF